VEVRRNKILTECEEKILKEPKPSALLLIIRSCRYRIINTNLLPLIPLQQIAQRGRIARPKQRHVQGLVSVDTCEQDGGEG